MKGLLRRLIQMALLWLLFQALREQLEQPPEERTWHGAIGPVPYDFRVPTLERVQHAYWNPDSQHLFSDKVVGLGWAINFAQVWRIMRELQQQYLAMKNTAAR